MSLIISKKLKQFDFAEIKKQIENSRGTVA